MSARFSGHIRIMHRRKEDQGKPPPNRRWLHGAGLSPPEMLRHAGKYEVASCAVPTKTNGTPLPTAGRERLTQPWKEHPALEAGLGVSARHKASLPSGGGLSPSLSCLPFLTFLLPNLFL